MDIHIGRKRDDDTAVKEHVTAPDRIHPFGGSRPAGLVAKMQPRQLRHWADNSEWCRAAINHRRRQVSQSQWSIAPVDPTAAFDPQLQAVIELLFLHPNVRQKTFRELIEPMVEDILVLDRGVCEKEQNVRGLPVALHLVNGGFLRTKPLWDGKPNTPRYEWWPGGVHRADLLDTQIILMMENPSSHRVDGFSPMEALKATIDADLEARDFNKRMVAQTNPNGVLHLGENVGTNAVDAFRVYWDAEVAGNKQMAIMGGAKNPQFVNLGQTAREMQYMQWQVYLLRKIAAVFGIAPQDLGVTFDINRANASVQQELSEDRGFKPLLRLIEEQFNTKVIADFTQTKAKQLYAAGDIDMQTLRLAVALTHVNPRDHTDVFVKLHSANILNLAFKFRMRSAKSTRDQADYNRWALAGLPWETVNQVRANDGLEPQAGGDKIIVMTPIGAMPLDMIGGSMVPQTEDQKRYLESLFQTAPLVLGRGNQSLVPVAGGQVPEDKEVVVVTNEIEVDEWGDPVED